MTDDDDYATLTLSLKLKKKRKNINKKWIGESVNKSFKQLKEPKKTLEKVALNK